jgi:nucleoside-diphosphate-sugar epimerase
MDVVVICPGLVLGPVLPPKVLGSVMLFMYILKGLYTNLHSGNLYFVKFIWKNFQVSGFLTCTTPGIQVSLEHRYIGCVDVRDVAKAMILLYENTSARGRHLCEEAITRFSDLVNKICDLNPEYQVKR